MPDNYNAFIDKSRRQPYICGICGRDILHPYHQPTLTGTGTAPVIARRDDEDEAAPIFEPEPEPLQMALF